MPKLEIYSLYNAARQASKHPEQASDYFIAAGVICAGMYVWRTWVYRIISDHVQQYPRLCTSLDLVNRLFIRVLRVVVIVGAVALAAGLAFVVYTFCSNLLGDLAAKRG